jgi:hypothetical protein
LWGIEGEETKVLYREGKGKGKGKEGGGGRAPCSAALLTEGVIEEDN